MNEDVRRFDFRSAEAIGDQLEGVLNCAGIQVAHDSALERMMLSTKRVIERASGTAKLEPGHDIRADYGDISALVELATQIVLASKHPNFSSLVPHLKLLNTTEASQTRKARFTDREANKVFELLTACYAMQWGGNVEIDHPVNSAGDNPDVIVALPEGRLGIACKVPYNKTPQSIIDLVEDGIRQIEQADCERGFVFLSLRNALDHARYWPAEVDEDGEYEWFAFQTFGDALATLRNELDEINASLGERAGGPEPLEALFNGRKAAPVIVFYAHAACGVIVEGKPQAATVKMPYVMTLGQVDKAMTRRLMELNDIMQLVPTV